MIWIIILNIFIGIGVKSDANPKGIPTTVKTFVNKPIELPCHTDSFGEPTRVRWWKEGILILDSGNYNSNSSNRITLDNWNLKIPHVQPDDAGEYVCKASRSSTWGDVTQVYAIEVLYPPSVYTIPESGELEVNLGSMVDMACVVKGVPTPTVTWKHNGKEVPSSSHGPRLQFQAYHSNLAGKYTCVANNSIGEPASANINLKIRYKPKVYITKPWIHTAPGNRVHLECKVKSWPDAQVEWYFSNEKLKYTSRMSYHQTLNPDVNLFSLIIKKVHESDYGNYMCNASNPLGFDKGFIQLSGAPKPVVLKSESRAISPTTYNFIWEVDSYVPITNCILMFRESKDDAQGEWHTLYVPSKSDDSSPLHEETFNLTGLSDDVNYEATIRCKNRYGLSEWTNIFRFSTSGACTEKQINYEDNFHTDEDSLNNELAAISQQSSMENEINGSSNLQFLSPIVCVYVVIRLTLF